MLFQQKEILLKDGRTAVLRSPTAEDAAEMIVYLKTCTAQTPFLLREPEECNLTMEQEIAWLEHASASETTLMIVSTVDGEIAGNCEISFGSYMKTRHRASVAIALIQKYWGLGIGTAMLAELIAAAKARGIMHLELEFIEGNARARALYEKMGFRITMCRPNSIRLRDGTLLNEYWMMKEL